MSNRLMIEALRRELQKIAVDANLFDAGIATYPWAQTCSEQKARLLEQIARLQGQASTPRHAGGELQERLF